MKKMFQRGPKREDIYKVDDEDEEVKERGDGGDENGPVVSKSPSDMAFNSFTRDVFTFFDIPHIHRVDELMNNCLPIWIGYLTGEIYQSRDIVPCEYRLGVMNLNNKYWISFRLKPCANESQRRELDRLFGCQDGNYQLCDPERLLSMNSSIFSTGGNEDCYMNFMKSTRALTDTDILRMEVMRSAKTRLEQKQSESKNEIADDCYASFTVWSNQGPWRKFVKKYDFETLYNEERELFVEIITPIVGTPSEKYLKMIENEMATARRHSDEDSF